MTYDNIVTGTFLKRPNRFIAYVEVKGDVKYLPCKKYRPLPGGF